MPRTSKGEAPVAVNEPVMEGRYVELGPYTVGFETYKADIDPAPLFHGLPGDRCQSEHWGVVISGRLILRYADRDEVYTGGDAYYGAPGHLPLVFEGTEVVEFSPTEAIRQTIDVIAGNLAAQADRVSP